jgi:hypothetical protein
MIYPFQAHWGRWCYSCFFRPMSLFTVNVGSGPSPLSCGVFLPLALLQALPLLVTGQLLPLLPSPAGLFIYSSCGKQAFPPLLWSFPPTATLTSFLTSGCWWVPPPLLPSLASLFIYSSMGGCPSPIFGAQGTPPSLLHVFVVVVYSVFFSFFPWVVVSLTRGLCWSGPGLSVGVPCAT